MPLAPAPSPGETPLQRAQALCEAGRFAEAHTLCLSIVQANPAFGEALNLLGVILAERGFLDEAVVRFNAAVSVEPHLLGAWSNRGNALSDLGDFEGALASFDTVLSRAPNDGAGHFLRALTLARLGRFAEALAAYDRNLVLEGPHSAVFANRGFSQVWNGSPKDGMTSFDRALALDPNNVNAAVNKGLLYMLLGDFQAGLPLLERRPTTETIASTAPVWRGGDIAAGKTLLLHAEQGFGDTIQFCRYVPVLAEKGVRVVLAVPPVLVDLMRTLDGAADIVVPDGPLPPHDFRCSLPSVPFAMGTTLDTIPARVPYLSADPDRTAAWRDKLAGLPGLRVGLVWGGAGRFGNASNLAMDQRRSIPLWTFEPLGSVPGVSFVSCQTGLPAAQIEDPPPGLTLYDAGPALETFAETAALFANLDLVITVDTASVHLAGALGRPVWLLNRFDTCWRWLLNREDSPWYPTARLFRQNQSGDWDEPMTRVKQALLSFRPGQTSVEAH